MKNKKQLPDTYSFNRKLEILGRTDTKILKGKMAAAEDIVSAIFSYMPYTLRIYNNMFFWNKEHTKICQIDHLIVTDKYIFVVETKDLYGYAQIETFNDKYWTITENGKKGRLDNGYLLYSPYKQNERHIEFLKEIDTNEVFDDIMVINVCALACDGIFHWNKESTACMCETLLSLQSDIDYLYKKNKKAPNISDERLISITQFIEKYLFVPDDIRIKHLMNTKMASAAI